MFAEMLGAEAGNQALRGLAEGGVVIGGGIPPKILPILQQPRLIERFNAKGRFSRWTRTLAVRVALEPRAALFGAAHHAAMHKDPRS
jgi:glucokinase